MGSPSFEPSNDNWHATSSQNDSNRVLWVPKSLGNANPNVISGEGYQAASNNGGNGGGDDGVKSIFKLDVNRDVQIIKLAVPILFGLLGTGWMYFTSELKEVRRDISDIRASQAGQTVNIEFIRATLDRIEGRLENKNSTDIEPTSLKQGDGDGVTRKGSHATNK